MPTIFGQNDVTATCGLHIKGFDVLTITVRQYDQEIDKFNCTILDDMNNASYDTLVDATIIGYMMPAQLHEALEDLPFDLVGKTFQVLHSCESM
jgi:hypothetical protein